MVPVSVAVALGRVAHVVNALVATKASWKVVCAVDHLAACWALMTARLLADETVFRSVDWMAVSLVALTVSYSVDLKVWQLAVMMAYWWVVR